MKKVGIDALPSNRQIKKEKTTELKIDKNEIIH